MTSTKRREVAERPQIDHQAQRPPQISSGDSTHLLGALFLSGMQVIPVSHRVWMLNKLSMFLGRILYSFNVNTTKIIRQNMIIVFQKERLPGGVDSCVRKLLSLIIWNSLVLNSLPVFSTEQITNLISIRGISNLDQCQDDGHPTLILGFHYGMLPLIVAVVLRTLGYPIHAITHVRQMPANASRFQLRYLRHLEGIRNLLPVIDPREGLQRNMLDVLRSNECLFVTPDYMLPPDELKSKSSFVVPVEFVGRTAFLQTGALRLAKRLKAKVITVLCRQGDDGKLELIIEPFELPTSGFKPTDLQQDLQSCMQHLEGQILTYPQLWLDLKRNDLFERLGTSALLT